MRSIKLIARPDEYDDTLGFVLAGCPTFDGLSADRTGLMIAHDVLEHQNGIAEMGAIWDELEALGGIWYVRGQWGDFENSYHSPAVNVASDVTRMFSPWQHEDSFYCGPGNGRVGTRAHDHDEDFNEIIEIARKDIYAEHNDIGRGEPGEDEHGWTAEDFAYRDEYLRMALHRMRNGFRKAKRRFERSGANHFYANNLFREVREAVGAAVKAIDFQGQEFVLRYGNGEATCREVLESWEY